MSRLTVSFTSPAARMYMCMCMYICIYMCMCNVAVDRQLHIARRPHPPRLQMRQIEEPAYGGIAAAAAAVAAAAR